MNLDEFIAQHGIKLSVEAAGSNPYGGRWMPGTRHFKCQLRSKHRRSMTVTYSMGPGLFEQSRHRQPTLNEVVETLIDDAALMLSGECEDMGVPIEPVRRQTEKFENLIGGSDALEAALEVER